MLSTEAIPRYCIFRGKKCRVTGYFGSGKFEVLGRDDQIHIVPREKLRFLK